MVQHELANHKCTPERIQVWQRGVDTARFNPSYKCSHMRAELSDGHPEAPLLVHVGRLGAGTAITKHACMYAEACVAHAMQKQEWSYAEIKWLHSKQSTQ